MKSIWKSVGAVVAGIAAGVVLQLGADALLRAVGLFPPLGERMSDLMFGLATLHRAVSGVFAAWLTARLAPWRPMKHALILGLLGGAVALLGAVMTWDAGPEFGPHWYPVLLVILALPQSWLGGWLFTRARGVAGESAS